MSDPFFDYPSREAQGEELVFLAAWTERDWQALVQVAEVRRFRKGETLARLGETDRSLAIAWSFSAWRAREKKPGDRGSGR